MTAQRPERIVHQNINRDMMCCPPLPNLDQLPDAVREFLRKPPSGRLSFNSGLARRYIGHWEINDNHLFFRGLELLGLEGRQDSPYPLAADWVTGTLELPDGAIIKHVHGGFSTVYEREIHIDVEKGVVRSTDLIFNRTPEEAVQRREKAFAIACDAGQMSKFVAWHSSGHPDDWGT